MTDRSLFENPEVEEPQLSHDDVQRIMFLQREMLRNALIRSDFDVLVDELCQLAESYFEGSVATVMLFNQQRDALYVANAPSLDDEVVEAFAGLCPGDGSCGNAVYHNEPMYVSDTQSDLRWRNVEHLAIRFHICSCFSFPITDNIGQAIGSFALSLFQPTRPSGFLVALLDTCASICSVIKQRQASDSLHAQVMEESARMRRLESLGVLAGGIAHDFNNLLTAVMGNIDLVLLDLPNGRSRDSLELAAKAVSQATNLSQKLLTVAKGNDPIKLWRDIRELIKESVELSLYGSNVNSELLGLDSISTPHVKIDPGQICQVIQNLVINARQAMPNGGTVRVTCFEQQVEGHPHLPPGEYLGITVSDSGNGMSDEVKNHLFDPYYTTRETGSGLGLFICHSVINRHGGWISVNSKVGCGTKITFLLPHEFKADAIAENPVPAATATTKRRNVLIMDDQRIIRDTLRSILEQLDHRVFEASSGEEALACFKRQRELGNAIDVSILDLTIPGGMGGIEALRGLRDIDPNAKVIVSSGYSAGESCIDHAEAGFDASIAKPYGVMDVEAAVAMACGDARESRVHA